MHTICFWLKSDNLWSTVTFQKKSSEDTKRKSESGQLLIIYPRMFLQEILCTQETVMPMDSDWKIYRIQPNYHIVHSVIFSKLQEKLVVKYVSTYTKGLVCLQTLSFL